MSKELTPSELQKLLQDNIVQFTYTKKAGEKKTVYGTTNKGKVDYFFPNTNFNTILNVLYFDITNEKLGTVHIDSKIELLSCFNLTLKHENVNQ